MKHRFKSRFFCVFTKGKLSLFMSKLILIGSTLKNTSRNIYLESLAYRAENSGRDSTILTPSKLSAMSLGYPGCRVGLEFV